MNSLQSALAEALGPKRVEKASKQAKFERAAEHGAKLTTQATEALKAKRLKDAIRYLRTERMYPCAAHMAQTYKRSLQASFNEIRSMIALIEARIRELEAQEKDEIVLSEAI